MDFAVQFWQKYKHDLPSLARFARYAFTIYSSSASAERSFFVLKRCFGKQQKLDLEDHVSLSCMLQINNKKNRKGVLLAQSTKKTVFEPFSYFLSFPIFG
jgi:hypothetical protein